MKIFITLIAGIIFNASSSAQSFQKNDFDQALFPNFRLYPSTVTQTEILSANHPFDEGTLFVTANTITFPSLFVSEGIYVTTNSGSSWYGSDTCYGANISFHNGDPGITIDKNGTFILTRLGRIPFSGIYSHFSTDNGVTWSPQITITTDDILERPDLTSDNNHLSSFFGNSYGIWVKASPPYPVVMAYTSNSGSSWSNSQPINSPPNRCSGGDIIMSLNSKILACWAGVTNTSPFTEIHVGFGTSVNGGQNWDINETAFQTKGIKGVLPSKQNIRVDGIPRIASDTSGGSRNGWIYIVTTQRDLLPAGGDPDIILNRSTDGGATWSSGIRVNQDDFNNGKIQFFPAIHVDNYGGINIIYYDDRNTTSDSAGLYLSRSTDGGDTWRDTEISDHNFKPSPIGGLGQGYQGDNIALTSIGNTLLPFWMDNSSGLYQVWTAEIDLTLVDVNDVKKIPEEFDLLQNYPNPFNPSTIIEFNIPEYSTVELKLYDVKGSEIALLKKSDLSAGTYKFNFNADKYNLSSGVYLIRIKAGSHTGIIKAVYLK